MASEVLVVKKEEDRKPEINPFSVDREKVSDNINRTIECIYCIDVSFFVESVLQ